MPKVTTQIENNHVRLQKGQNTEMFFFSIEKAYRIKWTGKNVREIYMKCKVWKKKQSLQLLSENKKYKFQQRWLFMWIIFGLNINVHSHSRDNSMKLK